MTRARPRTLGVPWIMACLLAAAGAARAAEAVLDYNNVVIVLDASGSMNGKMRGTSVRKMDAAKTALREVLKQAPKDTHIGLLVFSGSNRADEWAYPLGPRDDARLMHAIGLPQPAGGTPLGAYIKKGADRLLEQRAAQHGYGTYRLLVVTDGEAQDRRLMERYVPEVVARGITIDVIGVDMKKTHTLATRVHSYRRADDPASLKKAVAEVFAEVAGTGSDAAGEDAFAQIQPIPSEVAAAMLKAVSSSGNQPIGTRPRAVATRAPAPRRPAPRPPPPSKPKAGKRKNGGSVITLVIVAIIVLMFVSRLARRRR